MLDSPSFHLVQALNSLVDAGRPARHRRAHRPRAATLGGGPQAAGCGSDSVSTRRPSSAVLLDPALRAGRRLPPGAREPGGAAHREHRRTGGRLHGPGRHDRAAVEGDGQARPAAGARHDLRRHHRQGEGAPREARLRRPRGEGERWLRPDQHAGRLAPDPVAARGLSRGGHRAGAVATARRLVARLPVHRRAAQPAGRPLRPRPRRAGACTGRVLPHRLAEPEGDGLSRGGAESTWIIFTSWPEDPHPGPLPRARERGQEKSHEPCHCGGLPLLLLTICAAPTLAEAPPVPNQASPRLSRRPAAAT